MCACSISPSSPPPAASLLHTIHPTRAYLCRRCLVPTYLPADDPVPHYCQLSEGLAAPLESLAADGEALEEELEAIMPGHVAFSSS